MGATFIQTPPQRLGRFQYTILKSPPPLSSNPPWPETVPPHWASASVTMVCHLCFLYGLGGDVHFSAISRSHLRLEVQEAFFFLFLSICFPLFSGFQVFLTRRVIDFSVQRPWTRGDFLASVACIVDIVRHQMCPPRRRHRLPIHCNYAASRVIYQEKH